MAIENEIFKRYNVDFNKLIEYGFKENKGWFSFKKLFHNNEFRAEIVISTSGEIQSKVCEIISNDEFSYHRIRRKYQTKIDRELSKERLSSKKILIFSFFK